MTNATRITYLQLGGHRADSGLVVSAILDFEDWIWAREKNWTPLQKSNGIYAIRKPTGKSIIYLHRRIMGMEPGDRRKVDHINRDTLDNRKANLRLVNDNESMQNTGWRDVGRGLSGKRTSQYRGVSWHTAARKWVVSHTLNGKDVYGGLFTDEDQAGEFARLWRLENMPGAVD
jgi:hypothetical protein